MNLQYLLTTMIVLIATACTTVTPAPTATPVPCPPAASFQSAGKTVSLVELTGNETRTYAILDGKLSLSLTYDVATGTITGKTTDLNGNSKAFPSQVLNPGALFTMPIVVTDRQGAFITYGPLFAYACNGGRIFVDDQYVSQETTSP